MTALAVRLAALVALAGLAVLLTRVAGTVVARTARAAPHHPDTPDTPDTPGAPEGAESADREDERRHVAPAAAASASPLAGATLMLVEDDRDSREALSALLELEGAAVTAVPDAETALVRLARAPWPPRAVVCDVDLPGLDGVDFLRPLRALERRRGWRQAPVLALTGRAGTGQRQRLLDAGFFAHLVKPGQAADLLRQIERACGLRDGRV